MANPAQEIRLRQATPADIDDMVHIHHAAFGPGIMNRLMYPGGMSDDAKSKYAAFLTKLLGDGGQNGSDESKPKAAETRTVVAERVSEGDVESPEIVAFAIWAIYREPRSEEEWNVQEPRTVENTGEGANMEVVEEFIGGIHALRRRRMRGDPAMCLRMLCCTPARGRLGAGSALLRWGLEIADREGLPCWLEATPQGYPLYKRFGFQAVEVLDIPVTERWGATRDPDEDWGANAAVDIAGVAPEGVNRTIGMWRYPVKH